MMELWGKMMVPIRKVLNKVTTGLGIRKTGLVKLRQDVRTCEYEDVHILWEMLQRNETTDVGVARSSAATRKKRSFWDTLNWATCTPFTL